MGTGIVNNMQEFTLYKFIWCLGITIVCCYLIGIPLLAYGSANIPYELTREEIAKAGAKQGEYLEQKQQNSTAWRLMIVGAGFMFTAIGSCILFFFYTVGWLGYLAQWIHPQRIHIEPPQGTAPLPQDTSLPQDTVPQLSVRV